MRTRIGNPSQEQHGKSMRVYDWIAPVGTDPSAAVAAMEAATGLLLRADTGSQHGFVNTSRRPDGSQYVAVHLYDNGCANAACAPGHGTVKVMVAPTMTAGQLAAMKAAVGEHPSYKLGLSQDEDTRVLTTLGFSPNDMPRVV